MKHRGPLLNHLDAIEAKCAKGDPTLKDLFDIFGEEGHYLFIFFLILPFLQPIPMMGLSTISGAIMSVIAVMAYLRRPPWLPPKWMAKTIPASTVAKIAEGSERIFEKLAVILYPRWKFMFHGSFRLLNTFVIVLHAVLLALPLPIPFSNAIPAWVILFQALGHLEEDGLFIWVSYISGILCAVYFLLIAEGVRALALQVIG